MLMSDYTVYLDDLESGADAVEYFASSPPPATPTKPISVSQSKSFPTSLSQPRSKHSSSPATGSGGSFRTSSIGT